MIAPADPRPADVLDGKVEFHVDPDAQPGRMVPALARTDRKFDFTHQRIVYPMGASETRG